MTRQKRLIIYCLEEDEDQDLDDAAQTTCQITPGSLQSLSIVVSPDLESNKKQTTTSEG